MIRFIITGNPISSKNSIRSGITKQGRNYTYTLKNIKDYKSHAIEQLKKQAASSGEIGFVETSWSGLTIFPIQSFCEVSFIFYCIDNRKRDLVNLIQLPCDLLQQAGIIENDYLIRSLDGSRIADIDKINPHTDIFIKILDKE